MPVRGDTTCPDAAAATASTERLITSDKISAIVGGDCSGVTTAMLKNVAMAKGIVMVSPSATSPADLAQHAFVGRRAVPLYSEDSR